MLRDVRFATVIAAVLTAAAMPTVARGDDVSEGPNAPTAASALSPDPTGTADTVVPGEGVPRSEKAARIGWLIETYLMDARTALRHDRVHEATTTLALARSSLRTLEEESAGRSQHPALFASLAAGLARADDALSAGDRAGADRVLADSEGRWRAALIDLDAVLLPQSGPAGYGR